MKKTKLKEFVSLSSVSKQKDRRDKLVRETTKKLLVASNVKKLDPEEILSHNIHVYPSKSQHRLWRSLSFQKGKTPSLCRKTGARKYWLVEPCQVAP